MGWLASLFRRRYKRIIQLADLEEGPVEIEGTIDPLDQIACPLTGREGVAIHYRAHAPGIAAHAYGGLTGGAMDVAIECREARDFILRDSTSAALVQVRRGRDVAAVHAAQRERHGLDLHAETTLVGRNQRVRVRGCVVRRTDHTPHRAEPYTAIVRADQMIVL